MPFAVAEQKVALRSAVLVDEEAPEAEDEEVPVAEEIVVIKKSSRLNLRTPKVAMPVPHVPRIVKQAATQTKKASSWSKTAVGWHKHEKQQAAWPGPEVMPEIERGDNGGQDFAATILLEDRVKVGMERDGPDCTTPGGQQALEAEGTMELKHQFPSFDIDARTEVPNPFDSDATVVESNAAVKESQSPAQTVADSAARSGFRNDKKAEEEQASRDAASVTAWLRVKKERMLETAFPLAFKQGACKEEGLGEAKLEADEDDGPQIGVTNFACLDVKDEVKEEPTVKPEVKEEDTKSSQDILGDAKAVVDTPDNSSEVAAATTTTESEPNTPASSSGSVQTYLGVPAARQPCSKELGADDAALECLRLKAQLNATTACCKSLQQELEMLKASSVQSSQAMLQDLTHAKANSARLHAQLAQSETPNLQANSLQADLLESKKRITELATELALERANVVQLRCDLAVARGLTVNAMDAQNDKKELKPEQADLLDDSLPPNSWEFWRKAERCDLCGKRQGFIKATKGFGWRERTHRQRCEKRCADIRYDRS